MRFTPGLALALPLLATAACGDTVYINDTIDLHWDFQLTRPSVDDDLHTPYVVGAKVGIDVSDSDEDVDLTHWHVASESPTVFSITSMVNEGHSLHIEGVANQGGTTAIVIYDGEEERARATIEVAVPDKVELDAHAWMIIGRDAESPVAEARVLENGTATYLVRYFQGGRELYGNGALTLDAPAEVTCEVEKTFLFEDREWLAVHAGAVGDFQLKLGAAGALIATVPVHVVPATDVDRVEIHGADEASARKDDWLVAMAQAYDTLDRRIFGVEYEWSVDDVTEAGEGDLYRYQYKPGQPAMLVADDGAHTAAAQLHVGEGHVDSSNNVGCAIAAPGRAARAASSGLGLAALALVVVVGRRRSKRLRALRS